MCYSDICCHFKLRSYLLPGEIFIFKISLEEYNGLEEQNVEFSPSLTAKLTNITDSVGNISYIKFLYTKILPVLNKKYMTFAFCN